MTIHLTPPTCDHRRSALCIIGSGSSYVCNTCGQHITPDEFNVAEERHFRGQGGRIFTEKEWQQQWCKSVGGKH